MASAANSSPAISPLSVLICPFIVGFRVWGGWVWLISIASKDPTIPGEVWVVLTSSRDFDTSVEVLVVISPYSSIISSNPESSNRRRNRSDR